MVKTKKKKKLILHGWLVAATERAQTKYKTNFQGPDWTGSIQL